MQTSAVNKGVDDVTDAGVGGRVHQQNLLISDAEHTANVHNQHDHDRRHDRGDRHMEYLLDAGRTVHLGSFIQIAADTGDGGQIDDSRPAGVLPGLRKDVQRAEPAGFIHEVDGCHAENVVQEVVQKTRAGGEDLVHDGDDNNS